MKRRVKNIHTLLFPSLSRRINRGDEPSNKFEKVTRNKFDSSVAARVTSRVDLLHARAHSPSSVSPGVSRGRLWSAGQIGRKNHGNEDTHDTDSDSGRRVLEAFQEAADRAPSSRRPATAAATTRVRSSRERTDKRAKVPVESGSSWAQRALDKLSAADQVSSGSGLGGPLSVDRMRELQWALEDSFPVLSDEILQVIQIHERGGTPSPARLRELRKVLETAREFPLVAAELGKDGSGSSVSHRESVLRTVFNEFDLDGSGDVGEEEMFALGRKRRALGQKSGEWTLEMNRQMLRNMGVNAHGLVSQDDFVSYFDQKLPRDPEMFAAEVERFLQCAYELRDTKLGARESTEEGTRESTGDATTAASSADTSPTHDYDRMQQQRAEMEQALSDMENDGVEQAPPRRGSVPGVTAPRSLVPGGEEAPNSPVKSPKQMLQAMRESQSKVEEALEEVIPASRLGCLCLVPGFAADFKKRSRLIN